MNSLLVTESSHKDRHGRSSDKVRAEISQLEERALSVRETEYNEEMFLYEKADDDR